MPATFRIAGVVLLLGLVSLAARTTSRAAQQASGSAPATRPAISDEWIDDARLQATLLEGAVTLMDIDRAPEIASLTDGLAQPTCPLELPAEPAQTSGAAAHENSAEARLGTEALYERAMDAVVVIGTAYMCPRCTNWHVNGATGFFITPGGALVTNYHVVDQPEHRALFAMTHDGRVFPIVKMLAGNKHADVAIVQVEPLDQNGRPATFATLPLATRSRVGQNVRVIHHADGRYYTLTEGIVSRRYIDERQAGTQWMTITADYARGSSGGPLFDDAGRVIGMVASTQSVYYDKDNNGAQQNLQMVWKQCVPVENIRELIE